MNSFLPDSSRDDPAPAPKSVATSAELARSPPAETHVLPAGWESLLGTWHGPPTSVLLHGPAGAGKSTLALLAAHRLYRSAVYISGEEGHGETMKKKLGDWELTSTSVRILDSQEFGVAMSLAAETGAEIVVVDSLGLVRVAPPDIAEALGQRRSLWLIAHEMKSAPDYRGPSWIGHAVDLVARVVRITGGRILGDVLKSRWGPRGPFSVPL